MQIFNCFLFVCFINLYNSFTFLKSRSTFISRDCRNKLNMGCDYYIDKNLHVYHSNDMLMTINLEQRVF
jgi:hypothetical protein